MLKTAKNNPIKGTKDFNTLQQRQYRWQINTWKNTQEVENLERKEQWSLPPRTYFLLRNRSCVDAGRLSTRGQVLPALLPAHSETARLISPFSRTCLRHLTFRGSGTPRQKKVAQMKEQIKPPEKIQLSKEEIANLSDAQFKALVSRCSQNWLNLFEK